MPAGLDVELMFEEGAQVFEQAPRVPGLEPADVAAARGRRRRPAGHPPRPAASASRPPPAPRCTTLLARHPLRDLVTVSDSYPLVVERERALFGAWYEFFPRCEGATSTRDRRRWVSGTFAHGGGAAAGGRATMGFDVVYLPPIHPIGTHRTARAATTR